MNESLTNLLACKGPMLLKSMSRERGRSPPSPGEPVMVKVLPLPVTPYVNSRPMNVEHHKYLTTFHTEDWADWADDILCYVGRAFSD